MTRARQLSTCLESMIRIQMEAYPDSWPDADKREAAVLHLFGITTQKDQGV